jgi:hypothetical protein
METKTEKKQLYYVTGSALASVYCFVRAVSEAEAVNVANNKITFQCLVEIYDDFPNVPDFYEAEEAEETIEVIDGQEVVKLKRETLVDSLPIVTAETEED